MIDSKVYDVSKFVNLHPGGANVLYADAVGELPSMFRINHSERTAYSKAGNDATQTFFGLHRHEVLLKPQYARLQVGRIRDSESVIKALAPGELSAVPYAESSWLAAGFYSPYYTQNHRRFQKAIRISFMEIIYMEALRCEENGKRLSQEVFDRLRCAICCVNGVADAHSMVSPRSEVRLISYPCALGLGNILGGERSWVA